MSAEPEPRCCDDHVVDYHGSHYPASDAAVQTVLNAPLGTSDGRGEWRWFRMHNGDLVLGVFPQGDTYMDVEVAVGEDYQRAEANGTLRTWGAES